jgi:Lon protease-like protein
MSPRELLPVIGLVDRVLLPGAECCLALTTVASYGAIREATRSWGPPLVGAFALDASAGDSAAGELALVGVGAAVLGLYQVTPDRWLAELRGLWRARREPLVQRLPFRLALVEPFEEVGGDPSALEALVLGVRRAARSLPHHLLPVCAPQVLGRLASARAEEIPGVAAPLLQEVPARDWQAIIESDNLEERLAFVLAHLHALGHAGATIADR